MLPTILDIATLKDGYRRGAFSPIDVVEAVIARIAAWPDSAVWINRVGDAALREAARALVAAGAPGEDQPLWGIPFAVKDNIDCAGLPTTAACPAFAYDAEEDAYVVARLKAAGALLVGKTNLDQFATGLNGTRSPYGAPRSVFNEALCLGRLLLRLGGRGRLGTGRLRARHRHRRLRAHSGRLQQSCRREALARACSLTKGLVPACRSLDCITVMAPNGRRRRPRAPRRGRAIDAADPYSREHAGGVAAARAASASACSRDAEEREFFGDEARSRRLYDAAIACGSRRMGGIRRFRSTMRPSANAPQLLYGGPWVAERLAAIERFVDDHAEAMDPTVRTHRGEGARALFSAVDAFRGQYRARGAAQAAPTRNGPSMDVLLLPTAPTAYTVEAMKRGSDDASTPISAATRIS